MVGEVAIWLQNASAPFEPYIKWEISPTKFPINSQEMFFVSMLISIALFVIVSLLTCKKPFNMERLLHRGKYRYEGKELVHTKLTLRNSLQKFLGIDSQYSCGDKILAWSVFIYSFGWLFLGSFVGVVVWNKISPWPRQWWGKWYFITIVVLGVLIGTVSTVWFTIGGTRDLIRMFKALAARKSNVLDDGRVIGHVSADDVAMVEKVDTEDNKNS